MRLTLALALAIAMVPALGVGDDTPAASSTHAPAASTTSKTTQTAPKCDWDAIFLGCCEIAFAPESECVADDGAFATRLNAIDQIAQIGPKTDLDAAKKLAELLDATTKFAVGERKRCGCHCDPWQYKRVLFALRIIQALGKMGPKACAAIPALIRANNIDVVLGPAIAAAQNEILNPKSQGGKTPNPPAADSVQKVVDDTTALATAIKTQADAPADVQTALKTLQDDEKKLPANPAPTDVQKILDDTKGLADALKAQTDASANVQKALTTLQDDEKNLQAPAAKSPAP
ncbi:MAG TPA: hypothetical protein VFG04_24600 [Planctomycetaceae bacterium]|nr:hypothetical protein [Planctomycetaceae bacterium]